MTQSHPKGPTQTTSEARGRGALPSRATLRGGIAQRSEGGGGVATLRHGCAGHGAGRSGRTERAPTPRAERSLNKEGALHPPPGRRATSEPEGRGAGGRGRGTTHRQTDRGRSAPPRSDSRNIYPPRPRRAASMAARREQARRRARRAGAPRPDKMPPLCCAWMGDEDTRRSPSACVSRYPRAERSGARRVPRGERSEPRGLAAS